MTKKFATFIVTVFLLVEIAAPAWAAAVSTGKCGDNLTWTLDNSGTLTITGNGAMDNYDMYTVDPPWYKNLSNIKTLVIDGGVSSIGNSSFHGAPNLSKVMIAEGVKEIRWGAFYYCERLSSITIPRSMTEIASVAFMDCKNIKDIYYGGSEAQWKAITIGDGNDQLRSSKVTIHYNSTTQGSVAVTVNGSAVKWTDASPFINSDGRTMVPLRAVGDALGLSVNWDGAKREAIFSNGSKTIFFPIDSNTAHTSDGRQITMDTAAIVIDGRTYAPIRYLAEFFGFTVDWDGGTKTVIIKGSGTVQNSNPVLAAYKDYIENKYEKEMFYTAESFALYDINNDGIVDLLVHGGGETNWTKLFTFQNSKVVFIKETTDITPYDNGVVELTFHSGSGTENHSYHRVSKEFEFELIYGYTTNVRDVPMSYTESTDGYTTKVSATTVENKVRQIIGNTKSAIEYYENNQVNRNSHLQ